MLLTLTCLLWQWNKHSDLGVACYARNNSGPNASPLRPNSLAAFNHVNGKTKPKGGGKPGDSEKYDLTSAHSRAPSKPNKMISCFSCGKQHHMNADCPEMRKGNHSSTKMETGTFTMQDIHHAFITTLLHPLRGITKDP
jgi:hypothetical protein